MMSSAVSPSIRLIDFLDECTGHDRSMAALLGWRVRCTLCAMRGLAPVVALVFLLGACTDADTTLEVIGTDVAVSTTTTPSDPHDGDSPVDGSIENWDDYSADGIEEVLSPRKFVCVDGVSFQYDPYDDSMSGGSGTVTSSSPLLSS